MYRESYHGPWQSCVVQGTQATQQQPLRLLNAYQQPLPLKWAKYQDLQVLKRFVDAKYHKLYDDLPYHPRQESDDIDAIPDCE